MDSCSKCCGVLIQHGSECLGTTRGRVRNILEPNQFNVDLEFKGSIATRRYTVLPLPNSLLGRKIPNYLFEGGQNMGNGTARSSFHCYISTCHYDTSSGV